MLKDIHLPRYERIWLTIGIVSLFVFLIVLGTLAIGLGLQPPGHMNTVIPDAVKTSAPFNKPILEKIGPNEYRATMIAQTFSYTPDHLEVPSGATVHFRITSPDVVHGLYIPHTNVNIMVIPGHITEFTYTFMNSGNYLMLCHEYCGAGHHIMMGKLKVT